MNTYLFSIQPKWCEKIFNGEKTIEVRKTAPKPPFKVVVYCTKRKFSHRKPYLYVNEKKAREGVYNSKNKFSAWSECRETLCINAGSYCEIEAFLTHGKVIGEFVCNEVSEYRCKKNKDGASEFTISEKDFKDMAIDGFDLFDYADGKDIYGIHIADTILYDKPKALHHFFKPCGDCSKKDTMRCTEESTDCRATTITRPPQSYMRIQDPDDFEKLKEIKK